MLKRSSSVPVTRGRRPVKRVKNTKTKRAQPRTSILNVRPRVEVKSTQDSDEDTAGAVIQPNGAYTFNFGLVNDGDDENDRNGKAIKHIDYDFSFWVQTPEAAPSGNVRVILGTVSGKYASAVPTAVADVMDNFDTTFTSSWNILRAYDPNTTKSFKIHHDSVYNVQSGTRVNDVGDIAPVTKVFQLPTIRAAFEQEYNGGSSSDVGNVKHFGLVINGDQSIVQFKWNAQSRFIDI